jgi:glycogen operon protein
VDWSTIDTDLLAFTRSVAQLRSEHPVFRRRRFFSGRGHDDAIGDIAWFTPAAAYMTDGDWTAGFAKSLAVFINGAAITEPGSRGERVVDDCFYLMFNAHHEQLDFTLPSENYGEAWEAVLDTGEPDVGGRKPYRAGEQVPMIDRSMMVLRRC